MRKRSAAVVLCLAVALDVPAVARALDKQGSSHGASVTDDDSGLGMFASVLAGVSLYNPSYAARPNNSGLALGRIAPHLDLDLIGTRLSIPVDLNLFTDKARAGFGKLVPSELDVISGLTSTWPLGPTAIEVGARFERDMPVDHGSFSQTYGDVRARWLASLAAVAPEAVAWLHGGDLTSQVTLGWFSLNPSYAARPDNSGRALLRYAAHVALAAFDGRLLSGVDATMFTDRWRNAARPSELDITLDVGTTVHVVEMHLSYERDMPVDRRGLVQQMLMLYAQWGLQIFGKPGPRSEPEPDEPCAR
ncbi:MAG: hypothetical protein ACHQ53_09580 [Polyangiales bacterium]